MAQYTTRTVTTKRREYVLKTPTDWSEIGKVTAALTQETEAIGIGYSDNAVTVEANDQEIVFSYECSREITKN